MRRKSQFSKGVYVILVIPGSCARHMCQNGATCISGTTSYACVCTPGWTGVFCDVGKSHSTHRKTTTEANEHLICLFFNYTHIAIIVAFIGK